MRARGLDAVISPRVVRELSGSNVLVTEWIDGTRLDVSASPDVPRLCGVALNAYLTMLLDTGVLHCDPHPGNLLRTRDGKLCILDWGMTLRVPPKLQLSILEFIAHINTNNLDAVPNDFVNLGFTPPDQLERVRNSGITDGLSFMLRQLSEGGGAKKVQQRVKAEFIERYGDVSDEELRARARADMIQRMEAQLEKEGVDVRGVSNVMEEMSRRNKELFQLPTWVLYTVRAFSTLEGLGLSVDENYAILKECFPYLARRLLTDESPRARKALQEMVSSKNGGGLDLDKLIEMSEGFSSYTVSTKRVVGATSFVRNDNALPIGDVAPPQMAIQSITNSEQNEADTAARRELAQVLLSKNGSTAQKLVIEEATRLADAALRNSLASALDATGLPERSDQGNSAIRTLRGLPLPARLGLLPITAGVEIAAASANVLAPLVSLDEDDRRALATIEKLSKLSSANGASEPSELAKLADPDGDLLKLASDPQVLDTASNLARRFASTLLHRAAGRIEQASDDDSFSSERGHDVSSSSGTTTIERTLTKSLASTLAATYRQAARAVSPDLY
uniref:ABC1 atypical kinase-like domain-containing protein n=1 Tax=Aureoumbra lagunensis TaxID=44058 RepID=A0A7S3JTX7_9STRA